MRRKRNLTISDFINEHRGDIYEEYARYGKDLYDLRIEEANVRIRVIKKEDGAIPKPCVFVLHNGEVVAAWMESSTISGGDV